MSRRFALISALVLSSLSSFSAREARAQAPTIAVTILRRTSVFANPSYASTTLGFLNPSTIGVTQVKVEDGFVRIRLRQIDRTWPANGYGYLAVADVEVDSGATTVAQAPTRPAAPPLSTASPTAAPIRRDSVVSASPPAVPLAAPDTTRATTLVPVPRPATPGQPGSYALETTAGLRPHNVTVEATTHAGKRGVRVVMSDEGQRRYQQATPEEQPTFAQLVVVEGTDFANGVIEAEIAGAPGAAAFAGARGFVGIAFRVQPDLKTFDAFYLRPTNGRAEDQERRNHAVQYISHPAWTWSRLRQETPSRYEAYVDLMPDAWTPIRIEVRGSKARLFVNGQAQPTLVVNDVKSGESGRGAIALWIDLGTVAHFRNLRVSP